MLSLRQSEEIAITHSGFKESKPDSWYAQIPVIFDDGTNIKYGIRHNISYKANGSAIASQAVSKQLRTYLGKLELRFRMVRRALSNGISVCR